MKTGGILLCAGFGSRLAPLTEIIPKPAIPFCGAPLAHYARRALERAGIEELGMNVCHLPDEMIRAMDGGTWCHGTRNMTISREDEQILGTGGGAARVARLMPWCDRYIIHHGDVLCTADLSAALESHIKSKARVTLVILKRPRDLGEKVRQSLGMIGVADHEVVRIRDWYKKGTSLKHVDGCDLIEMQADSGEATLHDFEPRCFSGIHIVERSVLEQIEPGKNVCLVTEIYRDMLSRGEKIHAFEPEEVFFADVGTPATYLYAQSQCMCTHEGGKDVRLETFGNCNEYACTLGTGHYEGPNCVYGDVEIPESVTWQGNVCLTAGAIVQPGECLGNEMRCLGGGIQADSAFICVRMPDTAYVVYVKKQET